MMAQAELMTRMAMSHREAYLYMPKKPTCESGAWICLCKMAFSDSDR
jgi:hypothetical protein